MVLPIHCSLARCLQVRRKRSDLLCGQPGAAVRAIGHFLTPDFRPMHQEVHDIAETCFGEPTRSRQVRVAVTAAGVATATMKEAVTCCDQPQPLGTAGWYGIYPHSEMHRGLPFVAAWFLVTAIDQEEE